MDQSIDRLIDCVLLSVNEGN